MKNIQEVYQRAIRFAAEKHGAQKVPSSELPYVVHLSNVAMEVMIASRHTDDLDLDFAVELALLHDVLEDTPTSEHEIKQHFGNAVLNGVKALTKGKSAKNPMADSLIRIKLQPKEVWAVKLADRITNLQKPPAHWDLDKIRKYRDQASEILAALGSGNAYLSERLKEKILEYSGYC